MNARKENRPWNAVKKMGDSNWKKLLLGVLTTK
jgi:hypothetical protein